MRAKEWPPNPQESPREGAIREPPLWTLPFGQREGPSGPSLLDTHPRALLAKVIYPVGSLRNAARVRSKRTPWPLHRKARVLSYL